MVTVKGNVIIDEQHSYSTPVLRTAGSLPALSPRRGRLPGGGRLRHGAGRDHKAKLIAGDIALNGRYALVTQADNYAAALSVYLPDGTLQYEYLFSNCYVTAIALRDDWRRRHCLRDV